MKFETDRLLLRPWKPSDFNAFVQMNSNPQVMRFFPSTLSPIQSIELVRRLSDELERYHWGMWALELKSTQQFIGMVGLQRRSAGDGILPIPFVEIAWRIDQPFWGQGYAPEAARIILNYAFDHLGLQSVYSLTALCNLPSQRVMQKIGMHNTLADFQHPKLETHSKLSWHCLYKITAPH
ncbi:GCN5 family acetyltransferase [Vibrio sp. UCD-FRSSP16_10]|uniref:GNAT family N-acetyltransferase n=1 Tax=unclassified Vibrio TaxID=2614977 RepID=UPI0007FE3C09|nr:MULTISPECIES: GNAT family N-acetyltransferase [unclassified Vibrio]OBT07310.1 GCN5 family acetyltransferase [Vibrio sp. UCD-FRSSP16_30]OBT12790.1 GCN5 family acetyltransferase [Vibrio sp. UCD-FRSSP16_10]